MIIGIGTTKKGAKGGAGPPNKEQNWVYEEQKEANLGLLGVWSFIKIFL